MRLKLGEQAMFPELAVQLAPGNPQSPGCRVYERFPSFRRAMLRGCLGRGNAETDAIPFTSIRFIRTACHGKRNCIVQRYGVVVFFRPYSVQGRS